MSVPTHPHRHASQKSKATRRKERERKARNRTATNTTKTVIDYTDGFDPSCLDRKLDLEADSDELAKQILENEGQTAVCTLFDAVEYLYDFFNNSPIPPAFLEEFAQKTNQKINNLRS